MKAHLIKDGKIINTVVVDSLEYMPGLIPASVGGGIGDSWDGIKIIPQIRPIIEPTPEQIEADKLKTVDAKVAEYLRDWVAKQPDAPAEVKDYVGDKK